MLPVRLYEEKEKGRNRIDYSLCYRAHMKFWKSAINSKLPIYLITEFLRFIGYKL